MPNSPESHTIRKGRASLPGQLYLVTAVTDGRQCFFGDFDVGCTASRTLSRGDLWPGARLLAWVLMPDHMHLLVELGDKESLSLVMQRVKSVMSREIRLILGERTIWQAGFHDHALRKSERARSAARYLIANPVRAGLVERVGDYPFWDATWLEPGADPLDI
jgi:putative transposase